MTLEITIVAGAMREAISEGKVRSYLSIVYSKGSSARGRWTASRKTMWCFVYPLGNGGGSWSDHPSVPLAMMTGLTSECRHQEKDVVEKEVALSKKRRKDVQHLEEEAAKNLFPPLQIVNR